VRQRPTPLNQFPSYYLLYGYKKIRTMSYPAIPIASAFSATDYIYIAAL